MFIHPQKLIAISLPPLVVNSITPKIDFSKAKYIQKSKTKSLECYDKIILMDNLTLK